MLRLCLVAALAGAAVGRVQDQCGPFTDVSVLFCPYVLEAYYTGITAGTSPTTFSPDVPITRGQAAVFTTKALNQALARGSRRAALGQWWTQPSPQALHYQALAGVPVQIACDGQDLWVTNEADLIRIRASDGRVLESSAAEASFAVLAAMGRVFATGTLDPGVLYMRDPAGPASVVPVATNLGAGPQGLAFDGSRLWTANNGGSVSIVTPSQSAPWPVTTVSNGFDSPLGAVFDGVNVWITDPGAGTLLRLDSQGTILQTVVLGNNPFFPVFDGVNLWVPCVTSNSVAVVRASTGELVATLTGNGLASPISAAFDGERVLVSNGSAGAPGISLWSAADLAPLGSAGFPAASLPYGAASDGVSFWIALAQTPGQLARF